MSVTLRWPRVELRATFGHEMQPKSGCPALHMQTSGGLGASSDVSLTDATAGNLVWSVGVSEGIGRGRAPRHNDAVASTIRLHRSARHRPNVDVGRRVKAVSGYADREV